ncbi:MAG: HDIG domain-containing protein [Patescibacteria group bacterium]|nr:MAG: HDIG domain-containing protein [Patescibacteria group bacterium]
MLESQTISVSVEALYILYVLQKNGFEGYMVGGAVRDTLITVSSLSAADYDFTTNAKPEQIQKIFPEHFYENIYGTVGVAREHLLEQMDRQNASQLLESANREKSVIDLDTATKIHESLQKKSLESENQQTQPKDIYEITTFRSDGTYADHRRPDQVTWGNSLKEDLDRRDFTINALAIQVKLSVLEKINYSTAPDVITIAPSDYTVIDLHDGILDLTNQVIKTVGDPNRRFSEDALRMLRAIRFSVQLNMKIEKSTFEAIVTNAQLLKHVSFERIRDEFLKMLKSNFPKEAILMLDETGLLKYILPELLDGKGVNQGGHHTTDVWTHNLDAIANCPSKDPIVRLATLLHDIAKPHTYKETDNKPTFYNHEIIGSRIAKQIAQRLKLSKRDIERIFLLVRYHMFYYQPEHTDASIRRFMRKVGLENINDILDLREADRLGSGARKTSWRLEEMKERMIAQLHQPFAITDMAINGHDLMDNLQLTPGPKLGEVLNKLFELVLENPELNTKATLLTEAKKLLS